MKTGSNAEASPINEVLFVSKSKIQALKRKLPPPRLPFDEYGIIFIKTNRGGGIPYQNIHLVKEKDPGTFLNSTPMIGDYYPTPPPFLPESSVVVFNEDVKKTLNLSQFDPTIDFVYFRLIQIVQLISSQDAKGIHLRFEWLEREQDKHANLIAYKAKSESVFAKTDWALGFPCPPDWKPLNP